MMQAEPSGVIPMPDSSRKTASAAGDFQRRHLSLRPHVRRAQRFRDRNLLSGNPVV
jgi:hypothetical protein